MANAVRCKSCRKTTRKKANVPGKRYRCKGCGGIDFEDIFEEIEIDFDDYDIIDEELPGEPCKEDPIEEPVDVEEPEDDTSRSSSYDDSSSSSSDDSSSDSSDCGSSDD